MQNNNFLNFFGLREAPFNVNLDPRFLFMTPQFEKTFSEVVNGIHDGNCFAVITGEVGTGKTTLMRYLRRRLMQQGLPTAFLFYTHLNRMQLLDFILTDFGIPSNSGDKIDGWKRLENWLVERHCGGKTPVLLVDEAQGLPRSAFEEIRRLVNLQTPREKLLQVVLAGELELEEKLKRVQMRELQQRITVRCKTATLNRDEIFDYVQSRLRIGGAKSQPLFQPDAMDAIYFHSCGIPRVINVLCEQALNNACASQVHVVTPQLVQEVARDLQWENASHLPSTGSLIGLATVDSAPVPRIVAPAPPLRASQALGEQPAVSPVSSSAEPTKSPSRSPILDPPTIPVQQSLANIALGTLRHLLAKLVQELENQAKLSHLPVQAKIRGRENEQYSPSPLAVKINNQQALLRGWSASPFWVWWFYGTRPRWWKEIESVVNLPRWRRWSASPFWAWWFYGTRPKWWKKIESVVNLPRWRRWSASPFWAWWFYGTRPRWWKEIKATVTLPRWRRRSASPF